MRRIERQCQMYRTARSGKVGRKSHVIFHVARREVSCFLAFEFVKQHLRRFAQRIHQDVQTSAMCHADGDFLYAQSTRNSHQFVKRDDGRVDDLYYFRKRLDGPEQHWSGVAWPLDEHAVRWKARFVWPFSTEFWVVDVDTDYQVALIATPDAKLAWIYARTPSSWLELVRSFSGQ